MRITGIMSAARQDTSRDRPGYDAAAGPGYRVPGSGYPGSGYPGSGRTVHGNLYAIPGVLVTGIKDRRVITATCMRSPTQPPT